MRTRLVVLGVLICFIFLMLIQRGIDNGKGKYALLDELLHFPSGKFIEQVAIGYDLVAADLVWIRAMQYFGEHYMTDLKFLYLYHILDIMTTLDRKFIHAYTFGALLLEHSAKEPENADRLLHKGELNNPNSWEIPFTRGFIYYIFRGEGRKAAALFIRASWKPNAPEMCKRFAGFTFQKMGEKAIAFQLWRDIYELTDNPLEKETALRNMKGLFMLMQMDTLDRAYDEYVKETGQQPSSIEMLKHRGFLKEVMVPPWEGEYFYIHKEKGRVWCTYLDKVQSPILMRMLSEEAAGTRSDNDQRGGKNHGP